jgi:hypothetical protein
MGFKKVSNLYSSRKDNQIMDDSTSRFFTAMGIKKSGGMGKMAITPEQELQKKLNKALEDADYWRLAYDKLLKHIENNDSYIRHLEQQLWGSR